MVDRRTDTLQGKANSIYEISSFPRFCRALFFSSAAAEDGVATARLDFGEWSPTHDGDILIANFFSLQWRTFRETPITRNDGVSREQWSDVLPCCLSRVFLLVHSARQGSKKFAGFVASVEERHRERTEIKIYIENDISNCRIKSIARCERTIDGRE